MTMLCYLIETKDLAGREYVGCGRAAQRAGVKNHEASLRAAVCASLRKIKVLGGKVARDKTAVIGEILQSVMIQNVTHSACG